MVGFYISEKPDGERVYTCKYCGHSNDVPICEYCGNGSKDLTEFAAKSYTDGFIQGANAAIDTAELVNDENAIKAAKLILKYCNHFTVCTENCVFYRQDYPAGCAIEYPYTYDIKDETGGKK